VEDERELVEELSRLRALAKDPGFQYYLNGLKENKETHEKSIFAPLLDIVEVLRQEYIKGHIHGLDIAMNQVATRISIIEEQLEALGVADEQSDGGQYSLDA